MLVASGRKPVYARVDGVVLDVDGEQRFTLMELELIEPYLFWAGSPVSYARYVSAVVAAMPQPTEMAGQSRAEQTEATV
jgi:hypothetical protein